MPIRKHEEVLRKKYGIQKTKKVKGKRVNISNTEVKRKVHNQVEKGYKKPRLGKRPRKDVCTSLLVAKIQHNMLKRHKKKWTKQQALAISYQQVKALEPKCKKYFN